jgi:hypothetical protein
MVRLEEGLGRRGARLESTKNRRTVVPQGRFDDGPHLAPDRNGDIRYARQSDVYLDLLLSSNDKPLFRPSIRVVVRICLAG